MKSYDELFALRGSTYDQAMTAFPTARRAEFDQLFRDFRPGAGSRVGDIPAGGGYLKDFLPAGCEWHGHEPCASFTNHGANEAGTAGIPLLPVPWPDEHVDIACSLAGLHHLEDKRPLFTEIHRVTRQGGRFVVSDVEEGSSVSRFLDDFVGEWNSTGHEGLYLNGETIAELESAGWEVERAATSDFHWKFADREQMVAFCGRLFDITRASPEQIDNAIETMLGTTMTPDGGTAMKWSLFTITCLKR